MTTRPSQLQRAVLVEPPFRIIRPNCDVAPLLVTSPHSGRRYPADFVASSRLDPQTLRRSEDSFVDELLEGAAGHGVSLLAADFPRAYCDVNREAWELDPSMFTDKLPPWCNTRSARVQSGFGTIARQVASGEPIYGSRLVFAEAEGRIRSCWQPYHAALSELISEIVSLSDRCVLLDCHSMPSGEPDALSGRSEPHFVVGDAHGTSCDPTLPQAAQRFLEDKGYRVRRNDPYAGGYITRHYGRPKQGVHALQLEISRGLYMDQKHYRRLQDFAAIQILLSGLIACLIGTIARIEA